MKFVRLKVLFVIENLSGGGAERVFVNLLNNIDTRKFEPVLVVINSGREGHSYRAPEGVRLVNLRTKKGKSLLSLIKTIQKEKPNMVFSNLAPINILCLAAKLLFGNHKTSYIIRETTIRSISISETKNNPFVRFFYTQLVRFFYPYADSIIALSNGSKEDLVTNFGIDAKKVEVIYNPIDLESIISKNKEQIDDVQDWDDFFNVICCRTARCFPVLKSV